MFIRTSLFALILRDGSKKDLLHFLSKCVLLFFLNSFIVSVLLFRYLIYLEFTFVYGIREYSNFILILFAKEPAQCPPQGLLPISSLSEGGSPILYTLSSSYCS